MKTNPTPPKGIQEVIEEKLKDFDGREDGYATSGELGWLRTALLEVYEMGRMEPYAHESVEEWCCACEYDIIELEHRAKGGYEAGVAAERKRILEALPNPPLIDDEIIRQIISSLPSTQDTEV